MCNVGILGALYERSVDDELPTEVELISSASKNVATFTVAHIKASDDTPIGNVQEIHLRSSSTFASFTRDATKSTVTLKNECGMPLGI